MISIAIAEDNFVAKNALTEKLSCFEDLAIVHYAANGQELLECLDRDAGIDLVLMDLEMPVMDGIRASEQVKRLYPAIKIVMVTIYDDDEHIFNAIMNGADSYILKDAAAANLYETIGDTLNGGSVMSPSIAARALAMLKNGIPAPVFDPPLLSAREMEILSAIAGGLTNKTIAGQLFISPFTVKRHIENIYRKLQARNRVELLARARNQRLI